MGKEKCWKCGKKLPEGSCMGICPECDRAKELQDKWDDNQNPIGERDRL